MACLDQLFRLEEVALHGCTRGPLPGCPLLQGKADSRNANITVTARVEPTVRARLAECLEEIAVRHDFQPKDGDT